MSGENNGLWQALVNGIIRRKHGTRRIILPYFTGKPLFAERLQKLLVSCRKRGC